jgi:hypothetical protein
MASAKDPKYTVVPQRKRLEERETAKVEPAPSPPPRAPVVPPA